MKSKEEIEQLAEEKYLKQTESINDSPVKGLIVSATKGGYVDGYTQCQEDIVEELKEWIDITLSAESKLGASDNVIEALLTVKYKIESLNKQD